MMKAFHSRGSGSINIQFQSQINLWRVSIFFFKTACTWDFINYFKLWEMIHLLCLKRYFQIYENAKEVHLLQINWIYCHNRVTEMYRSEKDPPFFFFECFFLFFFFFSKVWKVMGAESVWALTAYSSESCSVHKTPSCKLEVIMLHLPQNHLSEDSYKLKCLNNIWRHFISILLI